MQYCPHSKLDSRANVIVAGTATDGTSLVISPFSNDSNVPASFADNSPGIARHCLEAQLTKPGQLVSSDYFSIDALAGIFFLVDQGKTVSYDILESVAGMALYEHGADRDIAHIVFILNAWMHPVHSPLNAQMFRLPYEELSNVLFEELLPRLPKIIKKVDYLERYWIEDEQRLETTEDLLGDGCINVREDSNLDLAVVTIKSDELEEKGRLYQPGREWFDSIHPMALHNHTSCSRIVIQSGYRSHFYYRADSLAVARCSAIAPRKNLESLVQELNLAEQGEAKWLCDPIKRLKPSLRLAPGAESTISPATVVEQLTAFLQI